MEIQAGGNFNSSGRSTISARSTAVRLQVNRFSGREKSINPPSSPNGNTSPSEWARWPAGLATIVATKTVALSAILIAVSTKTDVGATRHRTG
ncbi:hypothetical protein G8764_07615 [Pseudomaricurvus alcaniphilus]|uniref:hypothetical protein n=1 Tax=Pseudomaricurvus alcaniphilus TaxID=1166482 RepID=UPI001409D5DA|nr:hypothetical protein [Pseudomaricurvus alcaniphilus]NHN37156.1 hypothetical protein [Pseudomaricurvus alcaniphilus]